jgi:hypothetical protein
MGMLATEANRQLSNCSQLTTDAPRHTTALLQRQVRVAFVLHSQYLSFASFIATHHVCGCPSLVAQRVITTFGLLEMLTILECSIGWGRLDCQHDGRLRVGYACIDNHNRSRKGESETNEST